MISFFEYNGTLTNASGKGGGVEQLNSDDAAWALTCAFLILTMQTGFAMLEGGCVSSKNMANIMIKNVCDVSIGGIAYWMFGYGLTYGAPGTAFSGTGDFFFNEKDKSIMGSRFSHYFFQFSFASTATTIVSGAIAERMKLHAYMIFSFLNVVVYAIPASWCWADKGFLRKMNFYDFAGVCVVHLNGGTSAIVSALMLGPRTNRFQNPDSFSMSSPVTALTGMFMLTWAWLGFNCGSTFGVTDLKWKVSAIVAVSTLNGAIGGGLVGLILSMIHFKGQVRVDYVINSILGGLVSVTGVCSVITTYESLIVGGIGALVAIYAMFLLNKLKIDDPVGAIPVHLAAASWGTCAVGIFGKDNLIMSLNGLNGILHGGSGKLLAVNLLGALCVMSWAATLTFLMLFGINKVMGIRMSAEEEYLGADYVDHNIHSLKLSERLEDALRSMDEERITKLIERLFMEISQDDKKAKADTEAALSIMRNNSLRSGASMNGMNGSLNLSRAGSARAPFGQALDAKPIRSESSLSTKLRAPSILHRFINGIGVTPAPDTVPPVLEQNGLSRTNTGSIKRQEDGENTNHHR